MRIRFQLEPAHIRVLSSVLSDLSAAFIFTLFTLPDILTLFVHVSFAIICIYTVIKVEKRQA